MRPISYIIADDDDLQLEVSKQYMNLIPNAICKGSTRNALDVIELVNNHQPDFLLLDVEMPHITGIQLAQSMKNQPYIIFVSSHTSYAYDAFEVDAIDFIGKPIQMPRLLKAVEKVRELIELKANLNHQEAFKTENDEAFFIKEKGVFVKIEYKEVNYIESLADFVHIYLTNGDKKIVLVNLKNLESQLPSKYFIRVSRLHMVHKQKITAIETEILYIHHIQLPIGKAYAEAVFKSITGNSIIKRHV
jgi:two-component system, LytTR family, response regulator